MADAGDFERLFRSDENSCALGDASVDVCESVVVPDIACLERLVDCGITAEERLGERDALSREFAVSPRTGRYHHVPGEAERLEVFERNPVRKSAIEIAASVDFHRLCDERHRGRGAYPVERVVVGPVEAPVDWLAGHRVGGDDVELHRVRLERRRVENVKLLRKFAVAKFRTEEISGREERFPRAVAGIFREALVVPDDAPGLSALEVASETCTRRHSNEPIESDAAFEEYVEYAGGEEAAHRAAFQYKSSSMVTRVHEKREDYTISEIGKVKAVVCRWNGHCVGNGMMIYAEVNL